MEQWLITNEENKLVDLIRNILPGCQQIDILTGYFYFSGFFQISGDVKQKKMRILIGMDAGVTENACIQEIGVRGGEDRRSDIEQRRDYYVNLREMIERTDFFDDHRNRWEDFLLFTEKIQDGTLEIRRTREKNHAKMYLFQNSDKYNQGGSFPGTIITGSSNFSYSGFAGRNEINVSTREPRDYREAEKLFQRLWNNSVPIVDEHNKNDFFTEVVEKVWINRIPNPCLLYMRALMEYFSVENTMDIKLPYEITKKRFSNLRYQSDAVKEALSIIKRHNGVIIADVVGLGKSVVASTVAHNLNMKTIIIAPPHLRNQWVTYKDRFSFKGEVFSSGAIEKVLDHISFEDEYLVIVDEAARFRNAETKDFATLHKICQGNRVMLLTATPFNNKPDDIFSLLSLFQIPARSTIRTVQNLASKFKELVRDYKKLMKENRKGKISVDTLKERIRSIADRIRDVIFPVIVRRTRIDLDVVDEYRTDLQRQNITFSEVGDPESAEYELGSLGPLYEKTTEAIYPVKEKGENEGFSGARYKPLSFLSPAALKRMRKEKSTEEMKKIEWLMEGQKNISSFMRKLLVRRFESSITAFRKTVDSLLAASSDMLEWYDRGKIPVKKRSGIPDISVVEDATGDEQHEFSEEQLEKLEELRKEKDIEFFDSADIDPSFRSCLKKDIELLTAVKEDWNNISIDPKLEAFSTILKKQLAEDPGRKIVVFSEFSDTVNYLYGKLRYGLNILKYTSKDATQRNRQIIERNFDAGIEAALQEDDYDILIATDAISEGYNLHRAGTLFNYDIPYNPTRVIQRVGRINRINRKMFDKLRIFNFFPTETGEKEVGIKTISTFKMSVIHALIGEDAKVLTDDEEINTYFAEKLREERAQEETESWDAQYRNELYYIRKNNPAMYEQAANLPRRSRVRRTVQKKRSGVLLFGKKGKECTFRMSESDGTIRDITTPEAFALMQADRKEKGEQPSETFQLLYQELKKQLFRQKKPAKGGRKQTATTDAVKALMKTNPEYREYLQELLFTITKLKSLPAAYMKMIRDIDSSEEKEGLAALKREVPVEYLLQLRKKAAEIDGGREEIILAEELI